MQIVTSAVRFFFSPHYKGLWQDLDGWRIVHVLGISSGQPRGLFVLYARWSTCQKLYYKWFLCFTLAFALLFYHCHALVKSVWYGF